MPNTTNYSFPTPADTDLVKNGADAIRDLGDAVDTAMNTALGTKKAGMVLLNTTSFSAVASQSINDVFSTTYDSYRIVFPRIVPATGNPELNLRLRVSGTDSSTEYYYGGLAGSSSADTIFYRKGNNVTSLGLSLLGSNYTFGSVVDIHYPNVAGRTIFNYSISGDNGSSYMGGAGSGFHNVATAYTGFTIFPASSNITGTLSVYGYNK
jgi:hypothetical protein